jgi:hypothetical protein
MESQELLHNAYLETKALSQVSSKPTDFPFGEYQLKSNKISLV